MLLIFPACQDRRILPFFGLKSNRWYRNRNKAMGESPDGPDHSRHKASQTILLAHLNKVAFRGKTQELKLHISDPKDI
jgi:hypothetical protein